MTILAEVSNNPNITHDKLYQKCGGSDFAAKQTFNNHLGKLLGLGYVEVRKTGKQKAAYSIPTELKPIVQWGIGTKAYLDSLRKTRELLLARKDSATSIQEEALQAALYFIIDEVLQSFITYARARPQYRTLVRDFAQQRIDSFWGLYTDCLKVNPTITGQLVESIHSDLRERWGIT